MARLFHKSIGESVIVDFDHEELRIYEYKDKVIIESKTGALILNAPENELISRFMFDRYNKVQKTLELDIERPYKEFKVSICCSE